MLYTVNGTGNTKKYLEVVRDAGEGYEVKITSVGENYTISTKEYLSKSLLDTCLRTGYLTTTPPATMVRKGA